MPQLKNARSTSTHSFDVIQKTLAAHKAKQITFEYDDNGRIHALAFSIDINGVLYPFRLPARVKNVEKILYGNYASDAQKEQAYRTAWANIRDWVTAQCALIDTGMVKAEEIFLPYMLSNQGKTFFEEMVQSQFLLPEHGRE
jgi:hypothetical protein